MCISHCTCDTVHYTVYTLPFTLCTRHYTLYTLHCTALHHKLFTVHFTLYTTHYTLYTVHFTLCTRHYTLYTVHFTLCTTHCSLQVQAGRPSKSWAPSKQAGNNGTMGFMGETVSLETMGVDLAPTNLSFVEILIVRYKLRRPVGDVGLSY